MKEAPVNGVSQVHGGFEVRVGDYPPIYFTDEAIANDCARTLATTPYIPAWVPTAGKQFDLYDPYTP